MTTMMDNDALCQHQTRIVEIERHHEEKFKKLKADHNKLEARIRSPQGDKYSAHTINEQTQGESHPRQTNNTVDDNNNLHAHRHEEQMTRKTYFHRSNHGGRPTSRLEPTQPERYDGTTDPNEHMDVFLTQTNLYTNW